MRADAAETGRGERMVSSSWAPSSGCTLCVCVGVTGGQAKGKGQRGKGEGLPIWRSEGAQCMRAIQAQASTARKDCCSRGHTKCTRLGQKQTACGPSCKECAPRQRVCTQAVPWESKGTPPQARTRRTTLPKSSFSCPRLLLSLRIAPETSLFVHSRHGPLFFFRAGNGFRSEGEVRMGCEGAVSWTYRVCGKGTKWVGECEI